MDRWSQFFGWVGVGALILAIPLAVVANLLTPRIQGWWAQTSVARARGRLRQLEQRLEVTQKCEADPFALVRFIGVPAVQSLTYMFISLASGVEVLSVLLEFSIDVQVFTSEAVLATNGVKISSQTPHVGGMLQVYLAVFSVSSIAALFQLFLLLRRVSDYVLFDIEKEIESTRSRLAASPPA